MAQLGLLSFLFSSMHRGFSTGSMANQGECSPEKANQPTIFPRSLKNRIETMSGGWVVDPGNVLGRPLSQTKLCNSRTGT